MRVCTYDDGSVIQLEEGGPCQDVLSSGAYLTDDVTEAGGGITDVIAENEPNYLAYALVGLAALFLLKGRF